MMTWQKVQDGEIEDDMWWNEIMFFISSEADQFEDLLYTFGNVLIW